MKMTIISGFLSLTIITTVHAGLGDLLNQAKEITSTASDAGKLIDDPTGSKARQEKKEREEQERQDRLAREEQERQDRLAREEQERKAREEKEAKYAQAEKERKEQAIITEERDRKAREAKEARYAQEAQERKELAIIAEEQRKQRIAKQKQMKEERKQKITKLIQQDREKALDRCKDWSDVKGDFIGQQNNYPMNLIMCRTEIKNKNARRPINLDKTFGVITMGNLKLKQNHHGDWLVEEITDSKPDEQLNDQERDFMVDLLINEVINGEYKSAEKKL